ncbi:MAG: TorF family putative porin [Kiritimatiellia bacterium]
MKKLMLLAVMAVCLANTMAFGADVAAGIDLASAYVFRGATFNDGLVAQPSVEISGLPVTFGVWGNFDLDDYGGNVAKNEFSEIDLYAGYEIPLGLDPFGLAAGCTEYTYPGGGAEADREVSLTASADILLNPTVALFYGFDGAIADSVYAEAGLGHSFALPADVSLDAGLTVGYLNPEDGADGFSHWTGSVELSWKMLSAGMVYIGQIDDEVLPEGEFAYDAEVAVTLGLSHAF